MVIQNIKPNTQFIDEIEIDAPVPFNIPIEFDGDAKYGEHDITLTVRYKDSVRDEIFITNEVTVNVEEPVTDNEDGPDPTMAVIPIILIVGAGIYIMRRRKKAAVSAS